jgi:Ca-activated chloride channel family protein
MATVAQARGFGYVPVAAATGEAVELAMQRLWLTGRVTAAGARLVVEHVFESAEAKPVEVVYCFGLPRDAALRRFRIEGEGFSVESTLRETEKAVKEYEEAVAQGSLASLARQYADGVINLTVGNLRQGERVTVRLEILAGVESRDDGFRFRFPFTLAPRYHAKARMIESAPGVGEMELPADEFGDVLLPPVHKDATGLHAVGFDVEVALSAGLSEVGSPSHSVRMRNVEAGSARVWLSGAKDVPDRDLILDAKAGTMSPSVTGGLDEAGRGHFVAIVPSTAFGEVAETPRRVVLVIDRSGSMSGAPMAQAKKAVEACLGALGGSDRFGLVAFDDKVETFGRGIVEASREQRDKARRFLDGIEARGGTELAAGFVEAARMLGGEGGDVMVLTDGQVAGTEQILSKARAAAIRIHMLGIGSASEDRFLAQLAKETGGVSRFVTPRERVDMEAVELFSSIGRPVASGIAVSGADLHPEPFKSVHAGTPLVIYGSTSAAESVLRISWEGGRSFDLPVRLNASPFAETARLLRGARLITDLESRYSEDASEGGVEKRKAGRVAARLKALSEEYGLASREMSLVAVVKRASDRPGEIPETRVVPVGMPQDVQFSSYFAGAPGQPPMAAAPPMLMRASTGSFPAMSAGGESRLERGKSRLRSMFSRSKSAEMFDSIVASSPAPKPADPVDRLLDLAAQIEPDGGMPGRSFDERISSTLAALRDFLREGHTSKSGAFRSHVKRLAEFLRGELGRLDAGRRAEAEEVLRQVSL